MDPGHRGIDDGSREVLELKKSAAPQCFAIAPRTVKSLKLFELIKAEDPSPFPALTQIEAGASKRNIFYNRTNSKAPVRQRTGALLYKNIQKTKRASGLNRRPFWSE